MELTLFWTDFSQRELENIYEYYREKAGIRTAKKLIKGIYDETLKLKNNQELDKKRNFQRIENKNSDIQFTKIIKSFIGLTKGNAELK